MKNARTVGLEARIGLPVAGVGSSVPSSTDLPRLGPPSGCVGHDF